MKQPRRRLRLAESASQQVPGAMKNPRRRKAENTRRRKAIEPAQSQISQTPPKANPGGRDSCHKACWSDSESPESKFVKYDSESVGDFSKDGLKCFKSVFGARRSVVALSCTVDGCVFCCSGTVVDHDRKKTWILTSASLFRKPRTQFEVYDHGIKDFVGGPMMDHEKRFIGITYFYEDTASFLPVEIAARCLKYFKKEKTLPWLRIKGHALHTLDVDALESICCNFARPPSGVLVSKICDISTEKYGGMKVGDIITELDGVTIYSTAQFTAMFLDKLEGATGTLNSLTVKAVVQRCTDKSTFVALLNVQEVASDEYDKSFQNRWVLWKSYGFGVNLE